MQSQRTVRTDKKEANHILKKYKYLIRQCYSIDFTVHISSHFLQSTLHCSCFIFYFLQSAVHLIYFIYHSPPHLYLPYLLHSWSFSLIVRFTFQPIPSLEINNLRLSLDKYLIWDRYSLLEAELRGFTTPCLFVLSKKYNRQFNLTSEWDLILQLTTLRVK